MSTAAAAEHHDHGPVDWPVDAHYGKAAAGKIGMWIFLLSDAFSFGGLLLAYGILRGGATHWIITEEMVKKDPSLALSTICPHAQSFCRAFEPSLGIAFTAGLTFLLICSSVTMVLAYAAMSEGNRKKTVQFLALTALGGLLFLCGQAKEYYGLVHEGLIFGHTARASTFYSITSFHGAHVLTGTIYILVMLVRTAMGKTTAHNIEVLGLFWHFVDLIWILVFTFVYLIP